MARKASFNEEEIQKARHYRDQAATIADYRKAISVILLVECGIDAERVADILGTSRRTVFRGKKSIHDQDDTGNRSWGGRRRCTMTVEQEIAFLDEWKEKAANGEVISVMPIHAALIERLGYTVPMSTTYRLLARHGWRKVEPDTRHPKSDPTKQDEFKKKSRKLWLPPV